MTALTLFAMTLAGLAGSMVLASMISLARATARAPGQPHFRTRRAGGDRPIVPLA